jgi:polyisoprenoid-binding protein YceI
VGQRASRWVRRGVINGNDFGLTWQHRLARGGVLVGEEVKIVLDVSAVRA